MTDAKAAAADWANELAKQIFHIICDHRSRGVPRVAEKLRDVLADHDDAVAAAVREQCAVIAEHSVTGLAVEIAARIRALSSVAQSTQDSLPDARPPEASRGRADRRDEREELLREQGRQEANSAIERALTGVEPLLGRSHIAHVLLKHAERIRLEARREEHEECCKEAVHRNGEWHMCGCSCCDWKCSRRNELEAAREENRGR